MSKTQKLAAVAHINHGQLGAHFSHWEDALKAYAELPCETEAQETFWGKWLSEAQTTIKTLEDERKSLVKPFNAEVKSINSAFGEAAEPAEAFKAIAKSKLNQAALARKQLADAAHKAAQLAAQAGDSTAVYAALATVPDDVKVAGASTKFEWVVDSVDLRDVPVELLELDLTKLKQLVKLFEGSEPNVPGIKFKQVAVTSARGSK